MPSLLIVNDDGMESPMLPPMVEKLSPLGQVRIAVPDTEQSWKAKAMTRFGKITVRPCPQLGEHAFSITGTPSDCVNLAVYNLFPDPPDWIISGINIGINAGTGFIINSGTVGAALEGALQNIPSVAFSTYLKRELFMEWMREKTLTQPAAREVIETTTTRMAEMMRTLMARGLPEGAMMLNVNFPGAVSGDTPVHWVPPQVTRYGALFQSEGDGYVHSPLVELHAEPNDRSDRPVVMAGGISVTPLTLRGLGVNGIPEMEL